MKMKVVFNKSVLFFFVILMVFGCGDDENPFGRTDSGADGGGDARADAETDAGHDGSTVPDGSLNEPPTTYTFASRFNAEASGVNHTGQTTRQILIIDLVGLMESLAEGVVGGSVDPSTVDEEGEVVAMLNGIFRAGSTDLGSRALPALTGDGLPLCQKSYEELGNANLVDKLAGQDDVTDYKDWDGDDEGSAGAAFEGVSDIATPLDYMDALFAAFETNVRACALDAEQCPTDRPLYVTEKGQHLAELAEKFLMGAVSFSQATDDYLDDATDGKGLLTDNSEPREQGAESSVLEHAWDEGFGYFGAAADYGDYTDDEIRGAGGREGYSSGFHDTDGDGCIDVFSEYNFAAAKYAARRDANSATGTDFTKTAFDAFVRGRWLITLADGALDESQMNDLKAQRDQAVATYEKVHAANSIHYANALRADIETCGTDAYSFESQAGHWSELKGFALSLQFNPRSPWNDAANDFAALHDLIGDAPVTCDADLEARASQIDAAVSALQKAYAFDASDVQGW